MDATANLTCALAEWRRLTDLEGEAILGDDWPGLAEQQTRKAQLQPEIQSALALVRANPSAEAHTSPEVERKFDSTVGELMALESYAHVHHIVSNVRGRVRAGTTPGHAIRAVFPGGTITGCPKVRCMEIIAQLEGRGRGAYTGSLGYLNRDGDLDLNILIRSLTLHRGEVGFRAGAGIVADSVAEHELDETRAKARGMLRALGGEG